MMSISTLRISTSSSAISVRIGAGVIVWARCSCSGSLFLSRDPGFGDRAGPAGALDAEPPARQGGALPHGRQTDMPERRIRDIRGFETGTVVLDLQRVA